MRSIRPLRPSIFSLRNPSTATADPVIGNGTRVHAPSRPPGLAVATRTRLALGDGCDGCLWGTKWGTVPHGTQPISAEFDLPGSA